MGEVLLIDSAGFSEARAISTVTGSGPYTVGWSGAIAYAHSASAVVQSLNYSSPSVGLLTTTTPSVTTAQVGPGIFANCVVQNTIADGIFTANCDGVTILACEVMVSGDDAISIHSGAGGGFQQTDTTVSDCLVQHAGGGGIVLRGGLRTIIEGNAVYGSFGPGVAVIAGNGFQVVDSCAIEGNDLRDCGAELQPTYTGTHPTVTVAGIEISWSGSNNSCSFIQVEGNHVRNYKGGGIIAHSLDASASLDSIQVLGNSIYLWNNAAESTGQSSPPSYAGIYVEKTIAADTEVKISENDVRYSAGEGVSIASSVSALVEIDGNLLSDLNTNVFSSVAAIKCVNTSVSIVTGNVLGGSVANVTNFADMNGAGSGSAIWGNRDAAKPTVNFIGSAFSGIPVGNGHIRWYGSGVPSSSMGIDGDYFERSDGGASTHLYFRSGGMWSAVV